VQIIDLFSGVILTLTLQEYILFYQEEHGMLDIVSRLFQLSCLQQISILHFFCILACALYLTPLNLRTIRKIEEHLGIFLKIFSYCRQLHFFLLIFYNKYLFYVGFFHRTLNGILLHFLMNTQHYNGAYCYHRYLMDKNEFRIVYKTFRLSIYKYPLIFFRVFACNYQNSICAMRLLLERKLHNLCSVLSYFSFYKNKSITFTKC